MSDTYYVVIQQTNHNNNETRFDTLVKAFEYYLKIGGDKSGAMIEVRVILKGL